jgi:hypothetical protein
MMHNKNFFLLSVQCNDWTQYREKCLKFFDQLVTNSKGRQICESNGATMISIQSEDENKFVLNFAKMSAPNAKRIWIGAKRIGSGLKTFEWHNKNAFNYSKWANRQPDNYGGREPFAEMYTSSGLWNDNSDQKLSFICEHTLNFE